MSFQIIKTCDYANDFKFTSINSCSINRLHVIIKFQIDLIYLKKKMLFNVQLYYKYFNTGVL